MFRCKEKPDGFRRVDPSVTLMFLKIVCFLLLMSVLMVWPAFAATRASAAGAQETEEEAAERAASLEAMRNITDQRTSLWGGTGLVFTRTAILLPRKQLGVSGYLDFSHYQWLQGTGSLNLHDPRRNDEELNFVADFGVTPYLEVGGFINTFLQHESADQFNMRTPGFGWIGLDAKVRLMDFYKNGLGIATTWYLRFPSIQKDADITSRHMGYGMEINASFKMSLLAEILEKLIIHGNIGFGHLDYFDTRLATTYAYYLKYHPSADLTMKDIWLSEDQYTGSLSAEYKAYHRLCVGAELFGYSMIARRDENLQLAPYVTYTMAELPFFKQVHKDILTLSLAGNFGIPDKRSAPQSGFVLGVTYHASAKF